MAQTVANFMLTAALAAALGAAALPAAAAGKVEVSFVKPTEFTDAGRSIADKEQTMKSLAEYCQSLGKHLPDGQTLRLEVLDIDLAGELEWQRVNETRILKGRADWPQMKLRYVLLAEGQTIKSGEASLANSSYFFDARIDDDLRYGGLPHEKRMIQKWFLETFTAPAQ